MVQQSRRLSQQVAKLAKDYDIVHTHDWFGAEAGFKAKNTQMSNGSQHFIL